MKYLAGAVLMVLVLGAYMSVSVEEAHAFGTSQPFGGLVTISTPGVTCDGGSGPYQINPATAPGAAGIASGLSGASKSVLPYYFPAGQTSGSGSTGGSSSGPTMGQWVLGWYDSTTDTSDCYEDEDPYTVYKVTLFGKSGSSAGSAASSLLGN